jgi:hypothetical protein
MLQSCNAGSLGNEGCSDWTYPHCIRTILGWNNSRDSLPDHFRKRLDIGTFDEAPTFEASVIVSVVSTQIQGLMSKVEPPACSSSVQCGCRQYFPVHTCRIFYSFCGFTLHKIGVDKITGTRKLGILACAMTVWPQARRVGPHLRK